MVLNEHFISFHMIYLACSLSYCWLFIHVVIY